MRYFAICSYLGTNYNGWQRQPNGITIQEIIENALSKILSQKIEITGSSRTDTGVHASMQTFHFDYDNNLLCIEKFIYKLNRILPEEIAIKEMQIVDNDFHARFNAKFRRYEYYILSKKDPILAKTSLLLYKNLDVEKMNSAATYLSHKTLDCKIFGKEGMEVNNYLCSFYDVFWKVNDKVLVFSISANRFLRGMVRIIVGYMLQIGEGKLSLEDFFQIVETIQNINRPPLAAAHGLSLVEVKY